MKPYHDPKHEGNSSKYHTGKECIERGCHEPAGTAWSHLWCQIHNAERIDRIDEGFRQIGARFSGDKRADRD